MVTCPTCGSPNTDAARFCGNCGSPLDTAPRPVEGERRLVTVLFADVAGSTELAERLDAEDWAAIMNGAFDFMNAAVTRYEGTVARLMGDAVLAFFGAPNAHEDDAERAVRAALEVLGGARDYAAKVRATHGVEFHLRLGINTGTSVLAFVGTEVRTEYTAMGDAVNVAARLQAAARPGTILISADTHRLVRTRFDFEPRGPLEIKGKQAAVQAYEVLGVAEAPRPGRGIEGLSSPLIGRDTELGMLRDRFARLADGHGSVVAVFGEAGVGKSRLVAEMRARAEEGRAGASPRAWYEGRAISYGHSIAYHPWQQIGRQVLGARDGDGPEMVRELIREFSERMGLPEGDRPFFEVMLAVDTEESRIALAGLDRDSVLRAIADGVIRVIRAAIRGAGESRPQVIVLDDLHWADTASLELIAQVSTIAAVDPLLVLCVLRPDRNAPSWMTLDRMAGSLGGTFTRIDLAPLDTEGAGKLLENLLRVESLPEEVRLLILRRAEGNPFFLEEVLRSLIDCGHVVREGGSWRAVREISTVTIPETLTGVLGARIDRLPDSTKRVAQTAAVLGRIFPYRTLSMVCRRAPARERIENVEPHLGTLTYEELVRERTPHPEREFIFKHALTRDVAYELLLRARRRELHRRAGEVTEELFPDRLEELAPVLAHHYREGGDLVRSARFALRAGARALKLYALQEALEHYEAAVEALESAPDVSSEERLEATLAWAAARSRASDYGGVLDRLTRAEALARELGDSHRLARVLSALASVHLLTGFPSRAVPHLLESQGLARELGDDELMILPFFLATETLLERDPREAIPQLQELVALAQKHYQRDIEGHATALQAMAHARLGDFDAADSYIARALELAPLIGSGVKEADIHIIVGMAFHEMGELEPAMAHARRGAELADATGAVECACAGYLALGHTRLERNELEAALAGFGRSLQLASSLGGVDWMNRIHAGVASAAVEGGSADAVHQLEEALHNARSEQDPITAVAIAERLARAYLRLDRLDEAEPHLASALDQYRKMGLKPSIARVLDVDAELRLRRGQTGRADASRTEARRLREGFRPRARDGSPVPAGGPA